MYPHAIGLDLGTSGVRGVLLDPEGHTQASARRTPAPDAIRREGGMHEQDPAAWWAALTEVLEELVPALDGEPARIAVDGTSGTLVATDETGHPVLPALMYDDRRAATVVPRLESLAPPEAAVHSASSSAAKLLWLRETRGLSGVRRVLHPADWVAGRLRGLYDRMDENNALKLGFDVIEREWPQWLKHALGPDAALLPEVVPAGTPLGPVDPHLAARLQLNPASRVVAGTTDSIAGFLATGVRDTATGVTSLGSTLALKQLSPQPLFAPQLGVYSHRLGDRWLAGGASHSGGAVLRRFFDDATLQRLSEAMDPDSDSGLDYLPLPAPGERFPVNDPDLLPRMEPRPTDDARFLQGLLEGIARIERDGYARLRELGAPPLERVLSLGGGARNPAWQRIRARILGVAVEAADTDEAALGSARLAQGRALADLHDRAPRA
ncbi:FGGY-family carbohydrate kinase [Thioalkalivibrio sp. ALJ24]|uniref:FGGY-family carbohydrate kinase n=1 Tax=Thioalkalivibrio sp. ALJ24 TaxID=545276 RepID=UPI000380A966|nr:FGGY-family carbohydrate kinase [Thioalkalivibrio sp. ALJ24]